MRHKRLLVSIVIATLLTAALLACLNGAPVVRAQGGDTPATFIDVQLVKMSDDCKDYCDPDGCSGSCSFDPYVSGPAGGVPWSGNTGWPHHSPHIRYRTQISSDTAIESISFWLYNDSGDPDAPLRKEGGWPPGSWGLPFAWPFGHGCTDLEIAPDRSYVVYSNTCEPITFLQSETETHLDKDVLSDFEYFEFSFDWEIRSVNGQVVDVPTGCVPIETVAITGPTTVTVGTDSMFSGDFTPEEISYPVDLEWQFQHYVPWGTQEWVSARSNRLDLPKPKGWAQWETWYYTGTKAITLTATNCGGEGYATDSMSVTVIKAFSYDDLISNTAPTQPILSCQHCVQPAEICGEGSTDPVCLLISWVQWQTCMIECWFYYLIDFLKYLFRLYQWWTLELINFAWKWAQYFQQSAALLKGRIYQSFEAFVYGLMSYYRVFREFFGSLGHWINVSSQNIIASLDEAAAYIAQKIQEIGPLIDQWGIEIEQWLQGVQEGVGGWFDDTMPKLGKTIRNYILFLRLIWVLIRIQFASAFKRIQLTRKFISLLVQLIKNNVVDGAKKTFNLGEFVGKLAAGLLTGLIDAINADTKAELFEFSGDFSSYSTAGGTGAMSTMDATGGAETMDVGSNLSYVLDGIGVFEDFAQNSPLAYAAWLAIGIIAIKLVFWTLMKFRDILEDIARF
jgi:hypothetical protein